MAPPLVGVYRTFRRLAGKNTAAERFLRARYSSVRNFKSKHLERKLVGENHATFWSDPSDGQRIGIYVYGSCDLRSVFSALPTLHQRIRGTCSIVKRAHVSVCRSDLLLQGLDTSPEGPILPTVEKLSLREDHFSAELFDRTFTAPGRRGLEDFPKTVIVLSIAADVARSVYKHNEHGFLVDPGGWWLNQSMTGVLRDLDTATWFSKNFTKLGKIRLEDFYDNFKRIIGLLRTNTGAQVIVYNVLTVEPGNLTHNYQFVSNSQSKRRREFNLALLELSRELDFSILDLDRTIKRAGILDKQMDFVHYPLEIYPVVSREVARILKELQVV